VSSIANLRQIIGRFCCDWPHQQALLAHHVGNIDYGHYPQLAPTDEILKDFRKKRIDWTTYEQRFLDLMSERAIETTLSPDLMNGACLLCAEHTPS